jgi:DNA-binding GntR family transcriptional regulator
MLSKFKVEQPKSLTEIVTDRLRQAIIDGEFGLGEAISEETLAASFGVSRTPVRDALMQLQLAGLVVVQSKRGSFVFRPSLADAVALCDYRTMLEIGAARMSHARSKATTLEALKASVRDMKSARAAGDAIEYGHADTRFHQAFFDHCKNKYLHDAYNLAAGRIAALRTHLTIKSAERRDVSFREHQKIVSLFSDDNLDELARCLTEHIDRTRTVYIAVMESGALDDQKKRQASGHRKGAGAQVA